MKSVGATLHTLFKRFRSVQGEMAWILVGQFFGFLGGFIGIKVLTNVLGPTGYGQLALGLTVAGLFNTYVYGPIANVVVRYFAVYRGRGELAVYFTVLRRCHRRLALAGVVLAVAAGVGTAWLLGGEWALIVLLSCLYGVASGVNGSFISLQNAVRQRQIVAVHQGADVWLRIGLSISLLVLFNNSGAYALLGYLLGTVLVTLSQRFFAVRNATIRGAWRVANTDPAVERQAWREFSGYATSFMLFAVFASCSLYGDRWILQALYGSAAVGVYAALYQIAASPVNIFFTMVSQLVVPIVFERAGAMGTADQAESSMGLLRQTVILSSVAALFITLAAAVLSGPLVRLLTNATFAEQHRLLPVMVFGLCLFNLAQQLTTKGLAFNRPRIYLWPKILQAATLLALAFLLARLFGVAGVAGAVCLSSLVYLGAVLLVNSRLHRGSHVRNIMEGSHK
jgi:O-antigen/teichoic acid export membrane protein